MHPVISSNTTIRQIIDKGTGQIESHPLLRWWFWLTALPSVAPDAPFVLREYVRRSRYTSTILLIAFVNLIISLATVPLKTKNPILLPMFITTIFIQCGCFWLNRKGYQRIAAAIVVIMMEAGTVTAIFTQGLRHDNLGLFDLLVQPEIFALSLLPAVFYFPLTFFNIGLFYYGVFFIMPKHNLDVLLALQGTGGLLRPTFIQLVVVLVMFFWVLSANAALKRGDRAETVALLQTTIAQRESETAQQREGLHESIKAIENVHQQVAQGNLGARVNTNNMVLWSIGGMLNNLLSRYQREHEIAKKAEEMEKEILQIKSAARMLIVNIRCNNIKDTSYTNTIIDEITAEIAKTKQPLL